MPKGIANNPDTDRRRQSKAGGRPVKLPPDTHVWHVRVTQEEREAIKVFLANRRQKAQGTDPEQT